MDYFLKSSDGHFCSVLHNETCPEVQQMKDVVYIGYYRGEVIAVRQAVIVAGKDVVLCPVCLNKNEEKS